MWELLLRSRKFIIGLVVVLAIVMFGIIAPMITRNPTRHNYNVIAKPPSSDYLLGTDNVGRDVFAYLCMASRNSLLVGVLVGAVGTLFAILFGALGAFKGGFVDEITNFVTNVVIVFPVLPLLIVVSALLGSGGRSLLMVGLMIALTSWPWAARSIRSQVLSLKEREFVNLARMSGMKDRTTVVTEVLPNMLAYIIMVFVILAGGGILAEAGISLIGIGPSNSVTLGQMLYWAMNETVYTHWYDIWWWFFPPGLIITLFLSAVFFMHAGMNELFNPRLRRA